jgi:hypothetical protein
MLINIIPIFCIYSEMPRTFKRKTLFVPLSDREKKIFLLKKQTSGLSLRKLAVQGLSKSNIHRQLKS